MKNLFILCFVVFSICFTTNSCTSDDLELTNPNTLSPDSFFTTKVQIESAVNAVYSQLQTTALYGRREWYMIDNMGHEHDVTPNLEANMRAFFEFTYNFQDQFIAGYWNTCFRGVNKANFVINNSESILAAPIAVISDVEKRKFIAEARFLRALYYFKLMNRFGRVPLYPDYQEFPSGAPRAATIDEVYNFIVADLEAAIPDLLTKDAEQDQGRATKGAAQALLGKVHLYNEDYAAALDVLNDITGYDLEADYFDNFTEEGEFGIESIFEVQYDVAAGGGDAWNSEVRGEGANHVCRRGQDYGNAAISWFNTSPTDELVNSFEPGDTRYEASIYKPGDTYNNGASVFVEGDFNAGGIQYPRSWKKYQMAYKQSAENQESGINVKYLRYSDVLLMMAECENELGNAQNAITLLNRVRQRAGVSDLPTSLSQAQVFDAVVKERFTELCGEQWRFDDLLRWGIAATELSQFGFTPGKNELWPIPETEISTNENMTLRDQNPGY